MMRPPCEGHAPARSPRPADRARDATCPRCGRAIPFGDATEALLETLAQLAQFGLDAEGHPLLERREDGR